MLLPLAIIIVWEGDVRGYAVILLTLSSSSSLNRYFSPWCLFGCNPLVIVTPHSGPKALQQRFAGVSCFCHSNVYPGNSSPFGFAKDIRRAGNSILLGAFFSCICISSSRALSRLIFGAWTVFLGLLLVFQIMLLVDSVCTQESRFWIIGTGHWGYAILGGVLGWAAEADTC